MLPHVQLPPEIALKADVGWGEATTMLTLLALFGSAVYNVGFFIHMGGGLASLLSPQDLLWGVLFSAPVIAITFGFLPTYLSWGRWAENTRFAWLGMIAVLALAGLTVWLLVALPPQYVYNAFTIGLVTLILLFGVARRIVRWRYFVPATGVITSLYVMFAAGTSNFYSTVNNLASRTFVVSVRDGSTVTGRLLRETSSFVFMAADGQFVAIPLSEVTQMRAPLNNPRS